MSNWWEKAQKDIDKLVNSKIATKTDAQLRAIDNWINDEEIQRKRLEGHAKAHDKIGAASKRAWETGKFKNRDQSYRQDPEYRERHKKRMAEVRASDKWQQNHKAGVDALHNDPERREKFLENWKKGNDAKYDNPEYWAKYYAGIAKRDADVEYVKERLKKSKQKIRKPVQTPLGVFETQTDAAKAHGLGNTETIRTRIKSPNPKFAEYKSLTVEEYEKLKK